MEVVIIIKMDKNMVTGLIYMIITLSILYFNDVVFHKLSILESIKTDLNQENGLLILKDRLCIIL